MVALIPGRVPGSGLAVCMLTKEIGSLDCCTLNGLVARSGTEGRLIHCWLVASRWYPRVLDWRQWDN